MGLCRMPDAGGAERSCGLMLGGTRSRDCLAADIHFKR
jgi:hypothetical protein